MRKFIVEISCEGYAPEGGLKITTKVKSRGKAPKKAELLRVMAAATHGIREKGDER